MGNGKKKARAAVLSVAGLAGTMLWQKKDWLKAMVQLRQYPDGWVVIQRNPEVFLTRTSEKSKENLFEYLSQSPWRLVDQVADGYFWMNSREEILLLTQKKVMKEYWSWTASRPFFGETPAEPEKHVIEDEAAKETAEEDTTGDNQ